MTGSGHMRSPRRGWPWTLPHQPLLSPLLGPWGWGVQIPGPSGPCLSGTKSGSLKSTAGRCRLHPVAAGTPATGRQPPSEPGRCPIPTTAGPPSAPFPELPPS